MKFQNSTESHTACCKLAHKLMQEHNLSRRALLYAAMLALNQVCYLTTFLKL